MTKIFMLFIFLFSTLFAEQESFPFLGITISTQTVDLKPIATKLPNRFNNPATFEKINFGIQYGVQTKDYRTTFTAEGNSDFQSIDVEVDIMPFDTLFGTPKIRPYIGGTLGYMHYDETLITQFNDNLISENLAKDKNTTIATSHGYYGLDFGLLFYLTDNIDLDVGYHYYFMDILKPLDTMRGTTFSLHYFY
jgi:hypothetical protein